VLVGLEDGADIGVVAAAARLPAAAIRPTHDRAAAIARFRKTHRVPRDPAGRFALGGRTYRSLDEVSGDVMFALAYRAMPTRERRLHRTWTLTLPAGAGPREAAAALGASAGVVWVEPNYLATPSLVPDDPLYEEQWAHESTEAAAGWDVETGDPGVVIAIVDTGVDHAHEDLAANVWRDGDGSPGRDFVDVDTAAYVAAGYGLVPGEDYAAVDGDPSDLHGHGTHVAGIAAAVAGNGRGVAGVCPRCRIMPVRAGFAIDSGGVVGGALESDDIAAGIVWAADHGARVINMSFGSPDLSRAVAEALDYAHVERGVVLVAAAGNGAAETESYPAAVDHVLAVAATAVDDTRARYSNFGLWVDVAAPGGDSLKDLRIWSTVPRDGLLGDGSGYRRLQGTSMAAPYVAGLAGLLVSRNPALDPFAVRAIVQDTVDPLPAGALIGTGRVNVRRALEVDPAPRGVARIASPADGDALPAGRVEITGTVSGGDWILEIAAEAHAEEWARLGSGTGEVDGVLGVLDTTAVEANRSWVIRLRVVGALRLVDQVRVWVGWRTSTGAPIVGSPTVADLDGDGTPEILLGTGDPDGNGWVHVWHEDGSPVPGWPFEVAGGAVSGSVAAGDVDGDGTVEVVATSRAGVHALRADGTALAGWPQRHHAFQSPTLVDLDGDGALEILAPADEGPAGAARVYAWHADGRTAAGWPVSVAGASGAAAADLDGDGRPEVVVGTRGVDQAGRPVEPGELHAWHADGTPAAGWPQSTLGWVQAPPALGDLDGDGDLEVIAAAGGGVFAWHHDGRPVDGWPQALAAVAIEDPPVLADLDGDGALEVLIAAGLRGADVVFEALRHDGTRAAGWPVLVPRGPPGTNGGGLQPVVGDVDGDGDLEVVATARDGLLAWHHDGRPAAGFAFAPDDRTRSAATGPFPVLADLDADERLEILAPASVDRVYRFDLAAPWVAETAPWPMYQHDPQHTGALPPADACADDAAGTCGPPPPAVETLCGPRPAASCRTPLVGRRTLLLLDERRGDARDRLAWYWQLGQATAPADFGDPLAVDAYAFCIYDESAGAPAVLFRATVAPGGTCRMGTIARPCWDALGTPPGTRGYVHRSRERTPGGINHLVLSPGPAGQAKITVSARGSLSSRRPAFPAPPLAPPLRVQLQAGNGQCWEATYSAAGVQRNSARQFRAQAD
jgi:subtilisin family serine protease